MAHCGAYPMCVLAGIALTSSVAVEDSFLNISLLLFNTELFLSVRVCWYFCNGNEAQEG